MISAFFDVARPALSLAFVALCVFALDRFVTWNSRRLNAQQTRRLFAGNRAGIDATVEQMEARVREGLADYPQLLEIIERYRRECSEATQGVTPRAVPVLRENARPRSACN